MCLVSMQIDHRSTQRADLGRAHTRLKSDTDDPAKHGIAVLVHCGHESSFFIGRKATITPFARAWFANVQHRVEGEAQAPLLDDHGE